jgi:hypothetical protein
MAWRIEDSVRRGEIDNRRRGRVCGRIWIHGFPDPVEIDLAGDACPDLAGCLLTFENPHPTVPLRGGFSLRQKGLAGDLTASRKVRVLEMPIEEAYMRRKKGLSVPEHMANSLYLEWFSEANGRVVIESADYKLVVSEPGWRLSDEDENQRRANASGAFNRFMETLSRAIEAEKHTPPEGKEWDEFDYEKFMRASDASTDKYMELLDKYSEHPDREQIVAREMGWSWLEEALESGSDEAELLDEAVEWDEDEDEFEDLPELEPDPASEGIDWIRDEDGRIGHPLYFRVSNSSYAFRRVCEKLGSKLDDADLGDLLHEYQVTATKLAGALNSLGYGGDYMEAAFVVAYLKRALNHLHSAQAALEKVAAKRVLPRELTASTRSELFQIRESILNLMEEFRQR